MKSEDVNMENIEKERNTTEMEIEEEKQRKREAQEIMEGQPKSKLSKGKEGNWMEKINQSREELKKFHGKMHNANNFSLEETNKNDETVHKEINEEELYRILKMGNTTIDYSTEEPSVIYFNDKGNLKVVRKEDKEIIREIESKEYQRYDEGIEGSATITCRLKKEMTTTKKGKNMTKIVLLMHKLGYQQTEIKMSSFSGASVRFINRKIANKFLEDALKIPRIISANIERTEITSIGVVSDWPNGIPELWEAMDEKENIVKMERMQKRIWDENTKIMKTRGTDNILVTFKGKAIKHKISIYNDMSCLRVRPFVGGVRQCFNCFRFGHIKTQCKSTKRCMICGQEEHGVCERVPECRNCRGEHKSVNKTCIYYKKNREIKEIMAYNNCTFFEATQILIGHDTSSNKLEYSRYKQVEQWPVLSRSFATAVKDKIHFQDNQETKEKENKKPLRELHRNIYRQEKAQERPIERTHNRNREENTEYYKRFDNREWDIRKDRRGIVFKDRIYEKEKYSGSEEDSQTENSNKENTNYTRHPFRKKESDGRRNYENTFWEKHYRRIGNEEMKGNNYGHSKLKVQREIGKNTYNQLHNIRL
ncbi:uncharacterized protein LOC114253886 [Monomorium pharaonis]|uniref:uncharacterized protein LOC114253886 n=1 Tax=Monomorium pharaonis TaxID=307658 RepID=UPI00102E1A42|nr:uncharacterized protein LOC114253886 [Monomorium pharaonis]